MKPDSYFFTAKTISAFKGKKLFLRQLGRLDQ